MNHSVANLLLRFPFGLLSRIQIVFLRAMGAHIGRQCRLVRTSIPRSPWEIRLHDGVALDERVVLLVIGEQRENPKIDIGLRTYVNRFTLIDASISIRIGADVMIGPFCYITDHDHGTEAGLPVAKQQLVEAPVVVGDNVWIGAGAIVLKGVTIGSGAVVGAGAVVTRDVAPGAHVVGVPARSKGVVPMATEYK